MANKKVLDKKKLLTEKFGDPEMRVGYHPKAEVVEFITDEDKKENAGGMSFICHICKGDHLSNRCPIKGLDTETKSFSISAGAAVYGNSSSPQFREDHSPVLKVSNFPLETNEADLMDLFQRFGRVKYIKIISDRETHVSRGFGFVTFSFREDAQKALETINGHRYGQLIMHVEWGMTRYEKSKEIEAKKKAGTWFGR